MSDVTLPAAVGLTLIYVEIWAALICRELSTFRLPSGAKYTDRGFWMVLSTMGTSEASSTEVRCELGVTVW